LGDLDEELAPRVEVLHGDLADELDPDLVLAGAVADEVDHLFDQLVEVDLLLGDRTAVGEGEQVAHDMGGGGGEQVVDRPVQQVPAVGAEELPGRLVGHLDPVLAVHHQENDGEELQDGLVVLQVLVELPAQVLQVLFLGNLGVGELDQVHLVYIAHPGRQQHLAVFQDAHVVGIGVPVPFSPQMRMESPLSAIFRDLRSSSSISGLRVTMRGAASCGPACPARASAGPAVPATALSSRFDSTSIWMGFWT
jgi:hypothetical protein